MSNVMFSIVVVCLNAGDKLKETVDSILSQTCSDYEIVVKDGLSTDGSLDLLQKDEHIKVYRKADNGIYDAMNQAIKYVNGDYVCFLNCGDTFYNKMVLSKAKDVISCMSSLKSKRATIFYGDMFDKARGSFVYSNPRLDSFSCYRNVPCHQVCFYKASLFSYKVFNTRFKVRADYEHFLWCFFVERVKMIYIPFMMVEYEGNGFSETRENRRLAKEEHTKIVKNYYSSSQLLRYKLVSILTFVHFRTWLANNSFTARFYNRVKMFYYRLR